MGRFLKTASPITIKLRFKIQNSDLKFRLRTKQTLPECTGILSAPHWDHNKYKWVKSDIAPYKLIHKAKYYRIRDGMYSQ